MTLLLGAATNYTLANDEDVEAAAGPYDMWRVFANSGTFDPAPIVKAIAVAAARGRRHLMVSTRVRDWAGIAAGAYDAAITELAQVVDAAARAAGVTLWLTNWHEPEDDTAGYSSPAAGRDTWKAQTTRFSRLVKDAAPSIRAGAVLMGWHELSKSSPWFRTWQWDAAVPDGIDWLGFDPYQNYGMPSGKSVRTDWVDLPMYAAFLAEHAGGRGLEWGFAEWGGSEAALTKHPTWMADTVLACAALGGSFALYFNNTTYLQTSGTPVPATATTFAMPASSKRHTEWIRIMKAARARS